MSTEKKLIIVVIIGIVLIGSFASYLLFPQVYTVAYNRLTLDQDFIDFKINELYGKYLNREADLMGLGHFKQRVLEGESFDWVENEIKNSEEGFVVGLYDKYLLRHPDADGLNYWIQQILEGKSYDWVENEFKNSEEYKMLSQQ